jgi:hypothetical protein
LVEQASSWQFIADFLACGGDLVEKGAAWQIGEHIQTDKIACNLGIIHIFYYDGNARWTQLRNI